MWTRLPPGADLSAWWHAQPHALPWADVPVHTVSAWCTAWRHVPVAALAAAHPTSAAVLVAAVSAAGTDVHGLVPLLAPRAAQCGDALEHRAHLLPHETGAAVPVAPLAHLTLEHTWCRRPHTLHNSVFDPVAERPLIARAIATVDGIARGQAPNVDAWPADEAAQLDCAKMRYYVRMCLTTVRMALDVQRAAQRIGAEALGAWTAAIVRRHVTSAKRAAALVEREQLPFTVVPPPAVPPATTCRCGHVPLPLHIDEPGALAALYAASSDARAELLTRGVHACAPKTGGRWALVSSGAVELNPYAYGAALPTAMFVLVGPDDPRPSMAALLAALYVHGWAPPVLHGLSELWVPSGDAMLWAVPELVWPSGAALGAFVRDMWAQPSRWRYDEDATLTAPFVPHPHVAWPRHAPRTARQTAAAWMAAQESGGLRYHGDGRILLWQALAAWIGDAVTADTLRAHGTEPPLAAIGVAVKREMGSRLFTQLSTIASHRVLQTVTRDDVEVFGSREYAQLEAWVAERRDRLCALFHDLTAPATVVVDGHTRLRADGRLTFVVEGPRLLQWRDFDTLHGGGHGRTIGSLIVYHLKGVSGDSALRWLQEWADTRAQAEAGEAPAVPLSMRRTTPADTAPATLANARAQVAQMVGRMSRVTETTAAWRYLRETRGLADAPRSLIEENPALVARARATFATDDGAAVACAQLGCVTASQTAIQLIHLDAATARKLTAPDGAALAAVKRTRGRLQLSTGRYDAVPIVAAPAGERVERVFVAEGPETALSVATAFPGEPVYAALGVGFIGGFGDVDAAEVVICRENDVGAAHIEREMRKAHAALRARFVRVRDIWPPAGYNDFNDVHQQLPGAAGSAVIRVHVETQLMAARPLR